MPSSFMKFSRLFLKGNVWRSVWRICMWILGLKARVNNFVRGWLAWRLARIGQVSFRNYLPSKTIYLSLTTERDFFFLSHVNSTPGYLGLIFPSYVKTHPYSWTTKPLLPSSHKLKLLTCLLLSQIISLDEWQAGVQVAYLNYGPVIVRKYANCRITLS